MKATRKFTAAVIAAGAASAVLTGCGQRTDDSAAPIVRAVTATTSADTGPYAHLTATQLLDRATDAMTAVSSLTMDLHATDDDGSAMHITAALTKAGKCAASLDVDGEEAQIIRMSDVYYLKGDAAYWRDQGGTKGPDVAETLDGKWLQLPASLTADFGSFCDLTTLMSSMSDDMDSTDPLSKGKPVDYDGTQVIPLTQQSSDGDSVVDVAAVGQPYILAVYTLYDDSNRATFTGFGETPAIAAPPANLTVDISQFGDLPGFSV